MLQGISRRLGVVSSESEMKSSLPSQKQQRVAKRKVCLMQCRDAMKAFAVVTKLDDYIPIPRCIGCIARKDGGDFVGGGSIIAPCVTRSLTNDL